MIFLDSLTIGFAGILCPTVAVDNSAFQRGISSQGVFQCLDTQICFHVCFHCQTEDAKIKAVENRRYIQFSIVCRDLCDICNALF